MRTITIDERDGLAAAVPTDAWPLGTVSRATDPFRPQPFANSLIDAVVRRA